MRKICICDIDGVVADSSARFAKAEEAKKQEEDRLCAEWYAQNDGHLVTLERGVEFELAVKKQLDKIYWETAFAPELVWLDTLIDGVSDALEQIGNHADYDYYFLTSRPESMRAETMKWLFHHLAYDSDSGLIMKQASQQYIKTVTWKAGVVELLVRLFSVEELCFIDDEQAHCDVIESLDLPCDKILCGSLQEALVSIREE